MFYSLKVRLLIALYIFLILCIPVGAYLVSQNKILSSHASEVSNTVAIASPSATPKKTTTTSASAKDLLTLLQAQTPSASAEPSPSETPSSPTIATSFGPTLSLKVNLEGRPVGNQSTKLFVGIIEGSVSQNPKFLLNFSVNLPSTGTYSNLSLAGLTTGTKYTALVKGSAQLAKTVEFTMSPNVTNLNSGNTINLLAGDLNEDNTVNSTDYSIVKSLVGTTSASSNWNSNADLNADGVINTVDLLIVSNNLGKTGDSGIWSSPIPKTATPSGSLTASDSANLPVGSAYDGSSKGYWIWVPK